LASLLKIIKINTRYKDRRYKMSLNKTLKTLLISFSLLSTATALSSEIFSDKAVSPKDRGGHTSYGIMQISDVWKPLLEKNGLTIEDLYEPCKNIQLGAYLYKKDPKNFGKRWKKYVL